MSSNLVTNPLSPGFSEDEDASPNGNRNRNIVISIYPTTPGEFDKFNGCHPHISSFSIGQEDEDCRHNNDNDPERIVDELIESAGHMHNTNSENDTSLDTKGAGYAASAHVTVQRGVRRDHARKVKKPSNRSTKNKSMGETDRLELLVHGVGGDD
jgi:hypothetical protein